MAILFATPLKEFEVDAKIMAATTVVLLCVHIVEYQVYRADYQFCATHQALDATFKDRCFKPYTEESAPSKSDRDLYEMAAERIPK